MTHPFRKQFFHRDHHLTHCTHAPYSQVLPMSYSSFFSSGLSAIQNLTPPPSPTQLVRPDSPIVPLTPTREATDATNQDSTPTAANPSQGFGAERPKLRRRRSSLTVNTSPLVQLKGSYRGAAVAVQRQNRSRSGSVNDFPQPRSIGFATEENNIIGRLRSGSIGNSLRCVWFHLATIWHTKLQYADHAGSFEGPGHLPPHLCHPCPPSLLLHHTSAAPSWELALHVAAPLCQGHPLRKTLSKRFRTHPPFFTSWKPYPRCLSPCS